MYTFELTETFLSVEETEIFNGYLDENGLDNSIWDVFSTLFRSGGEHTRPFLLKAFKENSLFGAAILIRCGKYGRSVFNNTVLYGLMDLVNIPYYIWIKFGCCMDMMSNPGFVKDPAKSEEVFKAMLIYLKSNTTMTVVTDYTDNAGMHGPASVLPALPHALIDCTSMASIEDYMSRFKNIKRKIRVFEVKHGAYTRIESQLDEKQVDRLKRCFLATSEKSVFYLPYQELYMKAAITTSLKDLKNVHYFIATIDDEFIGYQAALVTGKYLNALHGAFDRNLKTTCHAYDILFVKMTEFALERGLEIIDFGAVINHTKAKMINSTKEMSYFIYSRSPFVQKAFKAFMKLTKFQGREQMKFRDG